MSQVHLSGFAVVLAVTTSAWAGIEHYPAAVHVEAASSRARSEVVAELQDAQRLGLMASVEFDFPSYKVSLDSGEAGNDLPPIVEPVETDLSAPTQRPLGGLKGPGVAPGCEGSRCLSRERLTRC